MSVGRWYVSRGRISRRVFWLHYVLPIFAAQALAVMIEARAGLWLVEPPTSGGSGVGLLSTLVVLASAVPSISSCVTRLHDRGHSAWWLLWVLLPFVGVIMLFVQTGFLRGEAGHNQYGAAPDRPVGDPVSV
jgi:uncharacterized membrane protein YhaH (DUF805 family)